MVHLCRCGGNHPQQSGPTPFYLLPHFRQTQHPLAMRGFY